MWHEELLRLDERTAIEAAVDADRAYRLALWRDGECLLEFRGEDGEHRKRVRERTTAHDFRSIERLRYEFEQEIGRLVDRT
jgi:hypothetical protein